jgi:Tol biopolymer transport system component
MIVPRMQNSPSVFISHSTKDLEAADAILTSLERAGVRCWIAPRDILEGEIWEDAIIRGITACQIVLCMLSSDALESEQVQKEIHFACEVNKRIVIPVRLENIKPSGALAYQVGRLQWLEATSRPIDRHLWKIVERVQNALVSSNGTARVASTIEIAPSEKERPAAKRRKRLWRAVFLGAGFLAVLFTAAIWYVHRPLPSLHISKYTKITQDGSLKSLAGTDGTNLFYNRLSPRKIYQVAIGSGSISPLIVAAAGKSASLFDVSPDGASLLVGSIDERSGSRQLLNVSIDGLYSRNIAVARGATFSFDGQWIAFVTEEGELGIVRADGTDKHVIKDVGHYVNRAAWSPDGRTIRFDIGGASRKLWEMSSNGSNSHPLQPDWHPLSSECCGRWTPDGKSYIFISGRGAALAEGQIWALNESRRGLLTPRSEPIQLTSGLLHWKTPIVSKDGKTIYAVGMGKYGELVRFDPLSKQLQPFLDGICAESVSFSKDGQFVAYVSYPDGILWRANVDGSNAVQLTDQPMHPEVVRWSPDGTKIAFTDVNPPVNENYYVSSDGRGSSKRILSKDNKQERDPNWSPDGKRILFASGIPRDRNASLRIVDVTNLQVTDVPESRGMHSPRWSPNGKYIVAMPWESNRLMVYSFDTERWQPLPATGSVTFPAWASDSQSIYYLHLEKGKTGVFKVSVNGGGPELVADLNDTPLAGWWGSWMDLDPSSNAPLLLRADAGEDIYALTLEEK